MNKTRRKKFLQKVNSQWQLHMLALPAVVILIIFTYVPIYGIQIAFKDYSPVIGMNSSPWVGFKHFINFFNSYYFKITILNTLKISTYSLIIGFPIPIILALLLNEVRQKKFKGFVQTITYAPHFISTVVIVGSLSAFLSPSTGIINIALSRLGFEQIAFMQEPKAFLPIYIISGIWQEMGWSSILYLAALSGVDTSMYEAAYIDGASKLKIMWCINIPSIAPTIIINLILRCGSLLSVGYEKIYLMQNSLNINVTEVISTYVYKVGLINTQYSFSTAVGLFNSLINLILLLTINKISAKASETSLF